MPTTIFVGASATLGEESPHKTRLSKFQFQLHSSELEKPRAAQVHTAPRDSELKKKVQCANKTANRCWLQVFSLLASDPLYSTPYATTRKNVQQDSIHVLYCANVPSILVLEYKPPVRRVQTGKETTKTYRLQQPRLLFIHNHQSSLQWSPRARSYPFIISR